MSKYSEYKRILYRQLWRYKEKYFQEYDYFFDPKYSVEPNPPVFAPSHAENNVLRVGVLPEVLRRRITSEIPKSEKHKWFRSMSSSQALALAVFGTLKVFGKLSLLGNLKTSEGKLLFFREERSCDLKDVVFEYKVDYLGERRATSIDVLLLFSDGYRVVIESKLSEREVGPCSRTDSRLIAKGVNKGFCSGKYIRQFGRKERCSLAEAGRKYWDYIPDFFYWGQDVDMDPCPVKSSFQLVRLVISACISNSGEVNLGSGHAVLIYDERNPCFQNGGRAVEELKKSLKKPSLLRTVSWQRIAQAISRDAEIKWLALEISEKYGF